MPEVVNVRFRSKGKAYFFDPAGTEPCVGDYVIVETAKGLEYGECVRSAHYVEETAIVPPLRPVIRIATDADKAVAESNKEKEKVAFDFCQKKIGERGLEMKLVDVEYSFDNSKILFFFTSGGRVDFRELVKDLAGVFRTRIELRQIGVRDSAKLVGGLGICGRPFCCSTFLDDFQPVSIKMAKTQSLSLNPTKISGTCGRLMCCLKYEQEAYEHLIKTVPKVDTEVDTPDGKGTVKEVNLLRRTVKVKLAEESISELRAYPARELGFTIGGVYKEPEPPEEIPEEQPKHSASRFGFGAYDTAPSLINDKPAEQEQEEHTEGKSEGGKSRHRSGRRHRNKKPHAPQGEKQPAAEKAEKPAQPQHEAQPKQEKQDDRPKNQQNRHKNKNQQPKQEKQAAAEKQEKPAQPQHEAQPKQENKGGQHNKNRRHRSGGKPKQGGEHAPQQQARPPKAENHGQPMDEKAKARAEAVAEAVAQAKPNNKKRHYYRRSNKSGGSGNKES